MSNTKTEVEHEPDDHQHVDADGRRFSKRNGEFFDENGRQFSGYDPAGRRISVVDDIFGEIREGGPDYRAVSTLFGFKYLHQLTSTQVGWIASAILMMKTQIGLGVLSIPETFDVLGMGPGLVALLGTSTTEYDPPRSETSANDFSYRRNHDMV